MLLALTDGLGTLDCVQVLEGSSEPEHLQEAYDFYLETYLPERGYHRTYAGKPDTKVLCTIPTIVHILHYLAFLCVLHDPKVRERAFPLQGYKEHFENFKANMEGTHLKEVRRLFQAVWAAGYCPILQSNRAHGAAGTGARCVCGLRPHQAHGRETVSGPP